MFLGEMGANTKMTRLYGWGRKPERVVLRSLTDIERRPRSWSRYDRPGRRLTLVIDGAMTGEVFSAYVQQQLAPTLSPDDIVMLDNLSSHKHARIRDAIEAVGGTLAYLSPYSPNLNPIERHFSKLKELLRKHAERTNDSLWTRIGQLVIEFTLTNAATISVTVDPSRTNSESVLGSTLSPLSSKRLITGRDSKLLIQNRQKQTVN